MKSYTAKELTTVLNAHAAWLRGEADGVCAYLRGAYLRGADLRGANLRGAYLRGANLSGANLSDAYLPLAPVVENIDAKILAAIESGGTLKMDEWHHCKTTHCRAGWAITLAGEAGKVLEDQVGPAIAGTLIYAASRPTMPIPNFYADNEAAMDSIRNDAATATA